jgi:uncharacterized sporulation protein YeaH/YhbH (DUF444 family)
MPSRIRQDHKDFRDIIAGRLRQALKKFITSGKIFRHRGGAISIPQIERPHIVHGEHDEGVGRGEGKPGDVVGEEPEKGQGGPQAGEGHADGILINIELEDYLRAMKEELELPNMKHKENQTFEEIKIRYNKIAKVGPRSLLHRRRTWKEALRRMIASGLWDQKKLLPNFREPINVLQLHNDDLRFRQYHEVRIPSSNAVIFFARDGSGSMDQFKCDIVSDMSWWIDMWIRQFYQKVERVYIWHDTEAKVTSEERFYKERYGGGTTCSSAMKLISRMLKHRYPPWKWNVYVFYFSDGENFTTDNKVFVDTIKDKLNPKIVNLVGITQVFAWRYENSLKEYVDKKIDVGNLDKDFVRTTAIGKTSNDPMAPWTWTWQRERDDATDEQIRDAIVDLLGKNRKPKEIVS